MTKIVTKKASAVLMTTLAAGLTLCAGCTRSGTSPLDKYETLVDAPNRDTEKARKHNGQAVQLLDQEKLDQAEEQLKTALSADMFFGPAHNNLGTVYFKQKKYYLSAWEFQYAAKLMPNHAEPRNNLGLVFEAVGRLDEAAEWYDKALALEPESTDVAGNLARVYVRTNRKDEKTRQLLAKVVMKDSRPEWVEWARDQLAIIGQPKAQPPATQPADMP